MITIMKAMIGISDGEKLLDTQPYIFLLLLIFGALELIRKNERFDAYCEQLSTVKRWTLYCFLLFCILALSGSEYQAFIYFKF